MMLRFESNGFLKQMVRNMVGLLVACGRGKFDPDAIPALLEARDRRWRAGDCAASGADAYQNMVRLTFFSCRKRTRRDEFRERENHAPCPLREADIT